MTGERKEGYVLRTRFSGLLIASLLLTLVLGAGCSGPKEDPSALVGSMWTVVKYTEPSGRPVRPVQAGEGIGRDLSLRFVSETSLSGDSGVNTFGSSYRALSDGSFSLGAIASTKMAGPQSLMDQEAQFYTALENAVRYEVSEDALSLIDGDDTTLVRFKRTEVPELEGHAWKCNGFDDGDGSISGVVDGTALTIKLEDGGVTGHAGVNAFSGSYKVKDRALTIYSANATGSNDGEPEANVQEKRYLELLTQVVGYEIVGTRLTLYGEDDQRLATFQPAP